ncbi:transposase [Colletotrichum incanum]|nr:transposase [Colletotrichum incanum]
MVQYTEDELNQALEAIANGVSQRQAARIYGIPKTTLQNRITGTQTRAAAFEDLQRLSVSQEAKLASWVQIQADLGLALIHQQIRERVNRASAEVIRDWFKYLAILAIMAIKPANRYNMDETGILKGKGSNRLVLGRVKIKSVRKKQPGSRAWVSIIKCISAKGIPLYPLIIYKGKTTTNKTAVTWLKRVFLPQTASSQSGQARLLILDRHRSHTTTEFIWQYYINNVYLLFLPNNSTIIGKRNFISCYQKARLAGLTAQNIKSGWKYTGLWPVAIAKPLISSLLLPKASHPPLTPLNQTAQDSQGIQGIQDTQSIDRWASALSAVLWLTPRKARELDSQLHLFSKLDQSIATQRQLFRKVKKGFQEQSFQLATA